jgi:DNA-binding beta-propeller fold protein YncE
MGKSTRLTSTLIVALLAALACDDSSVDPTTSASARLYITSGATDEVLVLDARDGRALDRITTERRRDEVDEPHGIAVAPDGKHWFVTLSHGDPTLWKFELPGDRLVGRVELATFGAARIGITPDSRRAFIPDYYRSGQGAVSGLAVVDLHTLDIVDRPMVCPAPHDAQVDPAGTRVAIACSLSDEVVVLNVETLEQVSRFYVDDVPGPPGSPLFKPLNLLWSPSGDTLYVGLNAAAEARAFDVEGNALGSVAVGAGPAQIALTADGRTLVTANRNDASVSLVDLRTFSERARVPLERPHPHGIALDNHDHTAFITYEGDIGGAGGVVALDLSSAEVVWSAEAGAYTLGIAYVPN